MHYLTNYYKNLCEQLQEKVNFLKKQLNESSDLMLRDDGHYDVHKITKQHIDWLSQQPEVMAAKGPVTLTLPDSLPRLPNSLVGPASGHSPVTDDHPDVYMASRGGGREYNSKMIRGENQTTNIITAIVRPHKETGRPFLITAFGGPMAPKEPNDPTLSDQERKASQEFWSQHALLDGNK
jgi:hypothetical protein